MKAPFLALPLALLTATAQATVINIDAREFGFAFPTDPAPEVGQLITPITNPPGGPLLQLTLEPGTYVIRNATGMSGADPNFIGWNYSSGWVWSVVVSDAATNQVVYYADRGGVQGTQASIAAQPDVQSFQDTFVLTQATTLNFMIRDYYLPDNAGGVAVDVSLISSVPDAPTPALLALGLAAMGLRLRGRGRLKA